jgi:CheY-like chemotaxis protein
MNKRILVVEDQPDNRQIIRDMLAPTDYEITEVESGEEALAAIQKAAVERGVDIWRTSAQMLHLPAVRLVRSFGK